MVRVLLQIHVLVTKDTMDLNVKHLIVMGCYSTLHLFVLLMVHVSVQILAPVMLVILVTTVNCGAVTVLYITTTMCVRITEHVSLPTHVNVIMDISAINAANGIVLVINAAETVLVMHPTSVGVTKDTMDRTALVITAVVFYSTTQRHAHQTVHVLHQIHVIVMLVTMVIHVNYINVTRYFITTQVCVQVTVLVPLRILVVVNQDTMD